ncbi:TonB-dependent receptor [Sphingomonas sanxanigenens]|uniref:Membrane protein n=1 Tax=Sphingomonas sanxanigenens DSM 19645 = NX02 TaxID=1123269 RepID=W0A3D1_9SPHN|nr:TonB-dependent receptor [Sphingomonas sanxanigenens]AHE52464.1 membrane protein [Sphingomonas sanxanigenens DSM 19645 = NX02]
MNRMDNRLGRMTPLLLGAAIAALAAAPAVAQTAPAPAGEAGDGDIVVTGYGRSLEEAIDMKRNTIGFSDSIIATDIADFPEQNLSEALQRLPGVTIERDKGLGTRVNVRGLPTEFTFVSINKLATASGSGGRDVEFDIFASELIQSVTVHKSPTAADEEGGIAGSVAIRTARPFDNPGLRVVGSAEGAYNSISEKVDPQFSFLASNTFGDFGVLISVAKQKRTNRTDSNSGINFRPISRWTDRNNANARQAIAVLQRDAGVTIDDVKDQDEVNRIVFLDKVGDRVYLNDQDRFGISGSIQYKPSNQFSLSFDAFIGSYDTVEDEYDAAGYSASSNSTLDTIHDFDATTLSDDGIVVLRDVSYTNTQHEFLSKEFINKTDYRQFGGEMNWETGNWRINLLGGYSGARKTLDASNLKHVAYAPSRTRYTENGGETIPSDDPRTIDMYNAPDSYLFEAYETTLERIKDDKYAAQIDVTYNFDFDAFPALKRFNVGGRYTNKANERHYGEEKIQGPTRGSVAYVNTRTLGDSPLESVTDIVGGKSYQARELDWQQISNSYARDFFRPDGFVTPFDDGQYYQVKEETLAAYAMIDFEFDIGPVPLFVNAGGRYVRTTVHSEGFHQVQNDDGSTGYTDAPISSSGRYEKFLPAFNAHAELTDSLYLRAAASQTLIRPALTDLAYKRTASWNDFRFTDGNPNLKPTYADQWEAGVEKYLGGGGILAASYFWKKIKGVVQSELTGVVPDVTKYNANGTIDGVYDFDVYQPVNAEGSYKVSGVELNAIVPLGMFTPWLEGFGINANYTFLDSSLTGQSDLGIPTSPIGLADNTYNATIYFERGPLAMRVSYNRKGAYVERIERNMYPVYRDAYGQFDLAASYQLTENFRVELQGINIGNAKTTGYTMDPAFPTTYEFSGSRISLGVRAQF